MSGVYDDIIHMTHHVSERRARMPMLDRAAQFSPFAALTGYDAAIRETGRLTDEPIELGEDAKEMLDKKLRMLYARMEEQPRITVTYYVPDRRKSGGAYVSVTGRIRKLDLNENLLLMEDGTEIPFGYIYDIAADIFRQTGSCFILP